MVPTKAEIMKYLYAGSLHAIAFVIATMAQYAKGAWTVT
jgi:hypothetical protein